MKSLILVLTILSSLTIEAQVFDEVLKATAELPVNGDHFGYSVSVSGNYAIIGARGENGDEQEANLMNLAGGAYIYERDAAGSWQRKQKLVASDRTVEDRFGTTVSISGIYATVAAIYEEHDSAGNNFVSNAGSVYIFKRMEDGTWEEVQKIVASDRSAYAYFGISLCMEGDRIIVGAPYVDEDENGENPLTDAGAAYIFELNTEGVWMEKTKLVESVREEGNEFGGSVALSGDFALIGARFESEDENGADSLYQPGAAYFFKRDAEGNWNEIQKVCASDRKTYTWFGNAVSMKNDYAIIAPYFENYDENGENPMDAAGAAYIFKRNPDDSWTEQQKIVASDRQYYADFGKSVCMGDHYAIAGAPGIDYSNGELIEQVGGAYLFKRSESDTWEEVDKVMISDREEYDHAGVPVALYGDYALLGVYAKDSVLKAEVPEGKQGAAYFFETCSQDPVSPPENIFINGDFENCSLTPWTLYQNTAEGAAGDIILMNGSIRVDPYTLAASPLGWHCQLKQVLNEDQHDLLVPHSIYNLRFDIRAEKDDRPFHVTLGEDSEPWNLNFLVDEYAQRTSRQFSYDVIFDTITPTIRITFDLGEDLSWVNIDNVELIELGMDTDGDGYTDDVDNCPEHYNPDQSDVDEDGWGYECDNCDQDWNEDQLDTDNDGAGDICDNCPEVWNQGWEDTDGDGAGDACDNCPDVWNEDQLDANSNGIGDACEETGISCCTTRVSPVIFPNPSSESITLFFPDSMDGKILIEIRDTRGRLIHRNHVKASVGQPHTIDISAYTSGVYIITLRDNDVQFIREIVKTDR